MLPVKLGNSIEKSGPIFGRAAALRAAARQNIGTRPSFSIAPEPPHLLRVEDPRSVLAAANSSHEPQS
jgi:hypothetical protein